MHGVERVKIDGFQFDFRENTTKSGIIKRYIWQKHCIMHIQMQRLTAPYSLCTDGIL